MVKYLLDGATITTCLSSLPLYRWQFNMKVRQKFCNILLRWSTNLQRSGMKPTTLHREILSSPDTLQVLLARHASMAWAQPRNLQFYIYLTFLESRASGNPSLISKALPLLLCDQMRFQFRTIDVLGWPKSNPRSISFRIRLLNMFFYPVFKVYSVKWCTKSQHTNNHDTTNHRISLVSISS